MRTPRRLHAGERERGWLHGRQGSGQQVVLEKGVWLDALGRGQLVNQRGHQLLRGHCSSFPVVLHAPSVPRQGSGSRPGTHGPDALVDADIVGVLMQGGK